MTTILTILWVSDEPSARLQQQQASWLIRSAV